MVLFAVFGNSYYTAHNQLSYGKKNDFIALDPMGTPTFIDCSLDPPLAPQSLPPITMNVSTFNGPSAKEYKNVLVLLPYIKHEILTLISSTLPIIQGYPHINFNVLKNGCSNTVLKEIRHNRRTKKYSYQAYSGLIVYLIFIGLLMVISNLEYRHWKLCIRTVCICRFSGLIHHWFS